jgi:hypothetical protein
LSAWSIIINYFQHHELAYDNRFDGDMPSFWNSL